MAEGSSEELCAKQDAPSLRSSMATRVQVWPQVSGHRSEELVDNGADATETVAEAAEEKAEKEEKEKEKKEKERGVSAGKEGGAVEDMVA